VTVVYGIVPAETPLNELPAGVAGAPVGRVEVGKVAALVSPFDGPELRATRRDLLSHSAVLEHAVARGPVLPLRFGTVVAGDEEVASELLEPAHDELGKLLDRFQAFIELRVKAFYDEESVLREIVRSDPAVARMREAVRDVPDGARHPDQLRLGEAVARALDARRVDDTERIFGRLRSLAADSVLEENESLLALTASFLVERRRVREFDEAMDEIARHYDGVMTFKYLGPLPPHSFVSMAEVTAWAS